MDRKDILKNMYNDFFGINSLIDQKETDKNYDEFQNIKYPRILFTSNPNHQADNVVYFEKYKDFDELPNIIDHREFYKDMKLPKAVNKAYN